MTQTTPISSQIDALKALQESKQQIRKELKASQANIKYKTILPLKGLVRVYKALGDEATAASYEKELEELLASDTE